MRPKPVEHHIRDATYRADRHARPAPATDGFRPQLPPGLSPDARTAWHEIVAALEGLGLLSSSDAALIEAGAVALGRARECGRVLHDEGLTVRGDRGAVVHPAARLEQQSLASWRLIASDLGLSPVARSRLGITAKEDPMKSMEETIGPSPRLELARAVAAS